MSILSKQITSQALSIEIDKFLDSGGHIEVLPLGYSCEFSNNTQALKPTAKMRAIMSASVASAHARKNRPDVFAREKARISGLLHYHGKPCKVCGATLRYVSTNNCFSCNKVSAYKRSQRIKKGITHDQ